MTRYLLRAYLIQELPVIDAAVAIAAAFGVGDDSPYEHGSVVTAIALLVLAPVIENALMLLVLEAARRVESLSCRALLFAVPFGGAHLIKGPIGITAIWSFYVIGLAYLAFRPQGLLKAYCVSVGLHSLANLIPAISLMF